MVPGDLTAHQTSLPQTHQPPNQLLLIFEPTWRTPHRHCCSSLSFSAAPPSTPVHLLYLFSPPKACLSSPLFSRSRCQRDMRATARVFSAREKAAAPAACDGAGTGLSLAYVCATAAPGSVEGSRPVLRQTARGETSTPRRRCHRPYPRQWRYPNLHDASGGTCTRDAVTP